jgi:mevalonate kinase
MENDIEILDPQSIKVKIKNGEIIITSLGLIQVIRLLKFLALIGKKIPSTTTFGKDNLTDLLIIADCIDEKETIELISILTNIKDTEKINEITKDINISLEVLNAVCEVNDFKKIFGNIQKTKDTLKKKLIVPEKTIS